MDDLASSGAIIDVTLRELETINRLLGGNYVTINGIRKLLRHHPSDHVTVADVGCGSGDMLRLIRKHFQKSGKAASLTGIDANPNIVEYARAHTPGNSGICFETLNIFSDEFRKRSFDIVTGTLFFHHFTNEELISFFRALKNQVRVGIVVNDIHRHWFAFYSIKWLTGLFSKSEMVRNDAPVSVLRAFKKSDLVYIMRESGFDHYSIRWMWAFRWQVVITI